MSLAENAPVDGHTVSFGQRNAEWWKNELFDIGLSYTWIEVDHYAAAWKRPC